MSDLEGYSAFMPGKNALTQQPERVKEVALFKKGRTIRKISDFGYNFVKTKQSELTAWCL